VEVLKEPELLTLGKSRYDPEVLGATKRYRERRTERVKQLQFIKKALNAIAVTNVTLDLLDNADDAADDDIGVNSSDNKIKSNRA